CARRRKTSGSAENAAMITTSSVTSTAPTRLRCMIFRMTTSSATMPIATIRLAVPAPASSADSLSSVRIIGDEARYLLLFFLVLRDQRRRLLINRACVLDALALEIGEIFVDHGFQPVTPCR